MQRSTRVPFFSEYAYEPGPSLTPLNLTTQFVECNPSALKNQLQAQLDIAGSSRPEHEVASRSVGRDTATAEP